VDIGIIWLEGWDVCKFIEPSIPLALGRAAQLMSRDDRFSRRSQCMEGFKMGKEIIISSRLKSNFHL
jgi:hypothetical protein